jgi:hypothetical protein
MYLKKERSKKGRFLEMSKMKISFSLLFTIFLVGILATTSFARGAYWQGLSPDGSGGFNYKFINTQEAPKDFTVKVYSNEDGYATKLFESDPVSTTVAYEEPTGAAGEYTTVTVPTTDYTFKVGTIYKFVLNDGSKDTAPVYGVLTTHDNLNMASIADSPTEVTVDVDGSKLYNANHTGTSGASKKTGQNTHGFYQNNTNSCAGCHQTHTAADGEYLLFKDGIYSTCSACHDGTTGAYNSFAPTNADTPNEIAGTFNVSTDATHNGSLHQADGSLNVNAAPAGNKAADATAAVWGEEFNCASCHAPHGSGSAAENNLNLDPLGWGGLAYKSAADGGTKDQQNGKLFKGLSIINGDDVAYQTSGKFDAKKITFSTPYIVVKKTVVAGDLSADKTKAGYLYTRAGVTEGQKVIQTFRWDGQKYVADYSLWMKSSGHVSAPFENANTVLTGAPATLNIVWRDAFAFGSAADVDAVTGAQISVGIDVETTNNIASLFDSANANYVYDSGTEMSKYCAACHVDYLSTTRGNDTGVYTQAHRHATAQDRLTCVRCHFGHGTDATIMKDANDESYFEGSHKDNLDYFVDVNPSSALKRYTGMSVCYACHGKGDQFMANPNVNHKQSTDPAVKAVYGSHAVGAVAGDALKNGDPGAARQ